jgi:hypothetical protein
METKKQEIIKYLCWAISDISQDNEGSARKDIEWVLDRLNDI